MHHIGQKRKDVGGSSNPPAPSQLSKSVLLCLEDIGYNMSWYKIKVDYVGGYKTITHDIKGTHHDPIHRSARLIAPYSNLKLSTFSTYVTLGHFLYCIGGRILKNQPPQNNPTSSDVHCVDFRDDDQSNYVWKQVASMKNNRELPHALVLDGKIFVITGTGDDDGGPWAEFYNPLQNQWEALTEPPSEIEDHELISAAFTPSNKILVSGFKSGIHYLYDLREKFWKNFGKLIDTQNLLTRPITVGKCMYWLDFGGQLCAYDITNGRKLMAVIKGLEQSPIIEKNPFLLHFEGQIFCLVWDDIDGAQKSTQIHCNKIRVSKESNDLIAYNESCSTKFVLGFMRLQNAQLL